MKRIFLDANIVLDYLLARKPWDAQAAPLWEAITNGTLIACVSTNTLLNVAYIARKQFDVQRMRVALLGLMNLLDIANVDETTLRAALTSSIIDFEDAVQHECALAAGAEAIITRDLNDFQGALIPVFTPADFITNIVIGRAVKISQLIHLHINEEWPDYPELPIRSVGLVEIGLSMLATETREEFFSILPRYQWLQGDFGKDSEHGEMTPERLAFETEQLTRICFQAWNLAPMNEVWPAAQKIIAQLER